jgi:hypothetical protein
MILQDKKYHLSLAGEFYVAAELQRRGVSATVTYGNAKRADVVAFSNTDDERVVKVEVKTTTSEDKWVIGNKVPERSLTPWVFVRIPEGDGHPDFFVLTQTEINQILTPVADEYRHQYLARHGEEFKGRGVETLRLQQIQSHRNAWCKIVNRLRTE